MITRLLTPITLVLAKFKTLPRRLRLGIMVIFVITVVVVATQIRWSTRRVVPIEDSANIVRVKIASDINVQEYAQIPQLYLALPEADWFSLPAIQGIAIALGFTDKAVTAPEVSGPGWYQDEKLLAFNTELGIMDFSSALNQYDVELPAGEVTAEITKSSLQAFLLENMPYANDLVNYPEMIFEDYYLGSDGGLVPAQGSAPTIMIGRFSYLANGLPLYVAFDSFVMVDAAGTIRGLSLLIPNLKYTNGYENLVDWASARSQVESGYGNLVSGIATEEFVAQESLPGYYINQTDLYAISRTRILQPVYLFNSTNKAVMINARKEN